MTEKTARKGRMSKVALGRVKLAAIVLSVATFVATLGGVVYANPAIKKTTTPAAQTVNVIVPNTPLVEPSLGAQPLTLPAMPQAPVLRPFARTRGS